MSTTSVTTTTSTARTTSATSTTTCKKISTKKQILLTSLMILAFYTCYNFTARNDWDYVGNDITSQGPISFATCCTWCASVSTCFAFSFTSGGYCYIKSSTGSGGRAVSYCIGAAR